MKGGIILASQGSVIVRVYTSDAYIPLPNAPVIITQQLSDGSMRLLAIRNTNSSGLTDPISIETPDLNESLSPGLSLQPYASVNIQVSYPGYNSILAEGVQIFPGVETIQGLRLQPTVPGNSSITETTPSQSSQQL